MASSSHQDLVIRGARQHNLKQVDCCLPRNRLVVLTGPSGSGKSSLAFDTIYAEGQRRYVESLSAYARQFLEQLPKPDVDSIEGLSPAIAIEQRALGKNPRSTVGTVTEVADYLRLLFARVGTPYCPISGKVLRAYTAQEMVDAILAYPEGTRLLLLAPIVRAVVGSLGDELESLRRDGFVRAKLDGNVIELGDHPRIDPGQPHDLDVVVDRIVVRANAKSRIADSVELALEVGQRTLLLDQPDGAQPRVMSERLVSWEHGITLPPLEPRLFSFNSPQGACPKCDGLGLTWRVDAGRLVPDPQKTLREGAIVAYGPRASEAATRRVQEAVDALGVDPDKPFARLEEATRAALLYGESPNGVEPRQRRGKPAFRGIIAELEAAFDDNGEVGEGELEDGVVPEAQDLKRFFVQRICEACQGRRLRPEALAVKIAQQTIADLSRLPLSSLRQSLSQLIDTAHFSETEAQVARPLITAINSRLGFLIDVGLDYLSLDRAANSLSGGEGQRIRLATQVGAALVGVLYVLDEPSVGLHARDNERLLGALRRLVDKGNTVLVVEHDRDAILAADYLVDMGPGAGHLGGQIVAEGTPAQVIKNKRSVTGPYLRTTRWLERPSPARQPDPSASLRVLGARAHNLDNVTVSLPLGLLTAVTGVSGSGKSSLVVDTLLSAARAYLYGARDWVGPCDGIEGLDAVDKVISIDQAPIGRTPRSNAATYTGIFTQLRELFSTVPEARARGYKAGRFSFNVKGGRCETCQGDGVKRVEMHFLPDVYVLCQSCNGQRYNRETLEVRYKGFSIADALDLTVDEATQLFDAIPRLRQKLEALQRVGLGYLKLGQPANTLSGGEAQRVKLASELARTATGKTLYVLDEPTTGLHFADIGLLSRALFALRDAGNTIVVIEHNLDLIAVADWVIDLGPEGGTQGGTLVAQGLPETVARCARSHTGRHLAALFDRAPSSGPPTELQEVDPATTRSSSIPRSRGHAKRSGVGVSPRPIAGPALQSSAHPKASHAPRKAR